jgi:hypothetical protein
MISSDKEQTAQLNAFETMLNNSAHGHVRDACKAYAFDFFNDRSTNASDSITDPTSPFTWTEEECNVEYFKPTVRLELKPRMSVSSMLSQDVMKSDQQRLSGARISFFSQTTSASTTLEESFVSLASGTSVSRCFEMFSSSEVKKDDESFMLTVTQARSRTFKAKLTQPVYEEECESGDDSINNRGSELADMPLTVNK